jgi:hypothetical protein
MRLVQVGGGIWGRSWAELVHRELRRAIAEGRTPECSAADNSASLAVVLALARSVSTRSPVEL